MLDFNLTLYRKASPEKRFFWEICNINSMPPYEITSRIFNAFREEIEALVNEVISVDCNLVGFSVNIASIGLAAKIATLIKKKDKNKIIIFGGTGCFWEHDRRLIFPDDRGAIDALVIGEGEEALEKIVSNYKNNKAFDDIRGVIYKKEEFLRPAEAFYTQDIDKLSSPTFSDFALSSYKERVIPILISRGCIGRCVFCIDHLMCGNYRYRAPEKIVDEIRYHIHTNKINNFSFNDLICNGNLKQLEKLCQLIIESGLNITWGSYAMIRKDMDLKLLKKMKKAGCAWLCYGVESGCNRTLKRMDKFYASEDAEMVIRATHEAGIQTALNIIVGFPGETEEDFQETLSFIKRNKDHISEITNVSSFVIMLASRIGRNLQEFRIKLPSRQRDLNFFLDENELDLTGRLKRVRKTIFVISNFEIPIVIVNQPGLKDYSSKKTAALFFSPPARTDLIPLRLASMFSSLRGNREFSPLVYDLNIILYQRVPKELKPLWDSRNWYRWSFKHELSYLFNSLEEEFFKLSEELISAETNKFCFLISRENLIFSLKLSSLLKKYNPFVFTIFLGSIFENEDVYGLIPPGAVDIIVFAQEESTLPRILNTVNTGTEYESLPNIAIYKNGKYIKSESRISDIAPDKRIRDSVDFSEFDLKAYGSAKLPLLLNLRNGQDP